MEKPAGPARGLIRNFQQPLHPFLEGPRQEIAFLPQPTLLRALSIRKKRAPYWQHQRVRVSEMIFTSINDNDNNLIM